MARKDGIEALLKESNKLLNEIKEVDNLFQLSDDDQREIISESMAGSEFETIARAVGLKVNGSFEIRINSDLMSVWADFVPPTHEGKPIQMLDVERKLAQENILFGIKWDLIENCITQCNIESKGFTDVLIAAGEEAKKAAPEHIDINKNLISKAETNETIEDYKEFSPFILVESGEELAKLIPEVKGINGKNVLGEEISFNIAKVPNFTPGKNVLQNGNKFFSACEGRFDQADKTFFVNEVLEVKSDVDYHSGNIHFKGDVIVNGEIKEGFSVETGGCLLCKKTLGASYIKVDKNLTVGLGIIGRNKGRVFCNGSLTCKFIENAYLEVKKDIFVNAGIMNSVINCQGKVKLGKKGVIVGGKITAQNGIEVFQVGTQRGPKTELICGIDFEISNRLEWIKEKSLELGIKLQTVQKALAHNPLQKLIVVEKSLLDSINKLNDAAMAAISSLDKNDKAKIIVRGSVLPDTYIEIAHVSYIVTFELKNIEFSLDKGQGKIVLRRLSS